MKYTSAQPSAFKDFIKDSLNIKNSQLKKFPNSSNSIRIIYDYFISVKIVFISIQNNFPALLA